MKIVHFAPFAPCACGLYEAARDMVIADREAGHEAFLVDVGVTINKEYVQGSAGKIDDRGGTTVYSIDPQIADSADIIIAHTGIPDNWIVKSQAPIIWILHGRPTACFKPEQFGTGHSYSLIAELAKWPRVKKMITFWPYHVKYWLPIIPSDKLICFPAPPIDEKRFSINGPKHDFAELGGKWNLMLADSWREDVDLYEITHGVIEFAKNTAGVKFHFYGMETPLRCWEFLIANLRKFNALGEVWARRPNIEEIYRSVDILLTPQRIVTRVVGEALSCQTPVIAANDCKFATYLMDPGDPEDIANTIRNAIAELNFDPEIVKNKVYKASKALSLSQYNIEINEIYNKLI